MLGLVSGHQMVGKSQDGTMVLTQIQASIDTVFHIYLSQKKYQNEQRKGWISDILCINTSI